VYDKWSTLLERLKAKELDLSSGLNKTPDRDKYLLFTKAWSENPNSIICRKERSDITDFDSLRNKTIAIERDYNLYEHYKSQYPKLKLFVVPSTIDALQAVSAGKADAYMGAHINSLYLIGKNLFADLQVAGFYNSLPQRLYMGVRNDYPILRDILQKGLDNISNQERQQIINRYVYLKSDGESTIQLNLTEKEKSWLNKHPVIKVHNEWNWPPFNYNQDGKPMGLSIDYMNLLANRIGIKVKYIPGEWGELLDQAFDKNLDVMLNIVKTPERQKHLLYTDSYTKNPNVIIASEKSSISDVQSLFDKKVAYPEGFFYDEILKTTFPEIIRVPMKDTLESLKAIQFGKVDAALGEQAVVNYLVRENFLTGLAIKGEFDTGNPEIEKLNIAVRNDWHVLASILNKAMNTINEDELLTIQSKWLNWMPEERQSDVSFTEEEIDWLKAHPNLHLGVDPSWPPYDFIDSNGNHSGLAADVLSSLRQKLGIGISLTPNLTWSQVLEGAQERTVDIVSLLGPTPERAEYLLFSDPISIAPRVIATRTDYKLKKGVESLYGKRVVVAKGYDVISQLRAKYSDLAFTEVATPLEALKKVSLGEADAYIGHLGSIAHIIREEGLFNLHVAGPTGFPPTELTIGIRSDWPELLALVNKGLGMIPREKMRTMLDRWRWAPMDFSTVASSKVTLSEQEQAWLAQHQEVTIAFERNFAPYSDYLAGGDFTGYAVDVVNLISQRTGMQFKIHPDGEWQTLYASAQKKEVDVVAEMVPREDRKEWFAFTDPYIFLSSYIYTKSNDTRVHSRNDITGMRVALIEDYSLTDYVLAAHPDVIPVYVKNALEALNSVQEGRADLFIGAAGIANHLINKYGLTDLHAAALWQQNVSNKSFGVRKDWPELVSILSKGLASISTQEWASLHKKWISLGIISEEVEKEVAELSLPEQVTFNQTGFFLQSLAAIFIIILVIVVIVWVVRGRPKQLTIRETLFIVFFIIASLIVSIGTFIVDPIVKTVFCSN